MASGINNVLASAARTTTGTQTFDAGNMRTLRAQLNVTAASGTTPTLNVSIEDSVDGTTWNSLVAFTQATGATRQVVNFTGPFTNLLRVNYVIAGTTPSFTFAVDIYAE